MATYTGAELRQLREGSTETEILQRRLRHAEKEIEEFNRLQRKVQKHIGRYFAFSQWPSTPNAKIEQILRVKMLQNFILQECIPPELLALTTNKAMGEVNIPITEEFVRDVLDTQKRVDAEWEAAKRKILEEMRMEHSGGQEVQKIYVNDGQSFMNAAAEDGMPRINYGPDMASQ